MSGILDACCGAPCGVSGRRRLWMPQVTDGRGGCALAVTFTHSLRGVHLPPPPPPPPRRAPLVFVVVVTDGAFAASLLGFLVMHFQLIAANCTSIEMYEKDRIHPWPYNKGLKKNLEEVFGRRCVPRRATGVLQRPLLLRRQLRCAPSWQASVLCCAFPPRSKLRWFLPLYSKPEKQALLDSCLNTRLLPATFTHSTPVPV